MLGRWVVQAAMGSNARPSSWTTSATRYAHIQVSVASGQSQKTSMLSGRRVKSDDRQGTARLPPTDATPQPAHRVAGCPLSGVAMAELETGHDRQERRKASVVAVSKPALAMPGLVAFGRIESERTRRDGELMTHRQAGCGFLPRGAHSNSPPIEAVGAVVTAGSAASLASDQPTVRRRAPCPTI